MRRAARCLTLLFIFLPLFLAATPLKAAETVQFAIEAGTTEVEVDGLDIRIEASAPVVVILTVDGEQVEGVVRTAEGTRSATVTITILGSPDRVIFRGRVSGEEIFREAVPHQETGQGEM